MQVIPVPYAVKELQRTYVATRPMQCWCISEACVHNRQS